MPVGRSGRSKSPFQVFQGQPGLDLTVFGDIKIVVIIDKGVIFYLTVNGQGRKGEKKADQQITVLGKKGLAGGILGRT